MAEILRGAPVAAQIKQKSLEKAEKIKAGGIFPTLAILRVGERPDDISYEKSAVKVCAQSGVEVKNVVLSADVSDKEFFSELEALNNDNAVHGILMFRPLPAHIDGEKARCMLSFEKDVDGCTDMSLAGVFTASGTGFAPCTAQAAMEILDYYGFECSGKRAVILGRSLVVGRPAAMMLMHKNATPTICHTRTKDTAAISKEADIVIACTGQMESLGCEYFREGQIVIDVGINWNPEKNKLCGDVRFDEVQNVVKAITPVPGGVGSVTTAVLVSHVVEAAQRTAQSAV